MMNISAFREYVSDLEEANQNDDVAFHSLIVRGIDLLQLLDVDLAHYFGTSRTTVMRWRTGANAPHPAMRKHVFAWFKQRAVALQRRANEPAQPSTPHRVKFAG